MTQTLAWAATLLGWAGTWTVGNGRRHGWLIGVAACGLWVAVNVALGLTAGIISAGVAATIAGRNWRRERWVAWQYTSTTTTTRLGRAPSASADARSAHMPDPRPALHRHRDRG